MDTRDQHVHLHGGGFPGVFYDLGAIEHIASLDASGMPPAEGEPKRRAVFRRLTVKHLRHYFGLAPSHP